MRCARAARAARRGCCDALPLRWRSGEVAARMRRAQERATRNRCAHATRAHARCWDSGAPRTGRSLEARGGRRPAAKCKNADVAQRTPLRSCPVRPHGFLSDAPGSRRVARGAQRRSPCVASLGRGTRVRAGRRRWRPRLRRPWRRRRRRQRRRGRRAPPARGAVGPQRRRRPPVRIFGACRHQEGGPQGAGQGQGQAGGAGADQLRLRGTRPLRRSAARTARHRACAHGQPTFSRRPHALALAPRRAARSAARRAYGAAGVRPARVLRLAASRALRRLR